ncbi:helix-turn-helix domain-containing protein [Nocardioides antri]|uniref:Transcriptional regulator n=1 Tax=Nocardioides antri TaxID=2607659 RepID=A0A5B1M1E2_9ACTN|nr:helix-turn-helix domain-containing protein [Nocardioides antri]KAA1426571.1 transcriptional regulator [Nocardioides antri]
MPEQRARGDEAAVVDAAHPLLSALEPLLERVQGRLVAPDDMGADDVPLVWEGDVVAGVRLPSPTAAGSEAVGDLGRLLEGLADELGVPLVELSRAEKQRAVRLLEERGAFTYRKSAETVAEALGVSRFTVYNYLNRAGS